MKAVILAGGKGTRLAPLTSHTPKPLVRVLDQPVMAHILALLAHYGVDEAVITVSYLAHEIRNRFGDEFLGIRLRYSYEETPLGTAGGVLAAAELLSTDSEESILVISGDAVCDFDLAQAAALHRQREAEASLLLQHSEHPLSYGVVKCREDGRILGFVEKPEWSQVCSDRVNTGIYFLKRSVLERIPRGIQYDFSADLFPKMLSEKARLYGCLCEGYWRDIGCLSSYYACNVDALNNKIRLYLPLDGMIRSSRDGKWYCSYGANVHEDARIGSMTVIGRGCSVEADAVIANSILCDDCVVEKGAVVKDSILDRGVQVKKNALVAAQSVVGYGSRLDEGCCCIGACLPAKSHRRSRAYFRGEDDGVFWEEDRFLFRQPRDRALLFRFGVALGKSFSGPFFLSKEPKVTGASFLAEGVRYSGACLKSSDADTFGVSAYSAAALRAYGVHLACGEQGLSVRVFAPDGFSLPREERKRLIGAFRSCPSPEEEGAEQEETERFGARELYLTSLLSRLPSSADGIRLQLQNAPLLERALSLRSWQNGDGEEVSFSLLEDGEGCKVSFSSGESVDFETLRSYFETQKKGGFTFDGTDGQSPVGGAYLENRQLFDPCYALAYLLSLVERHTLSSVKKGLREQKNAYTVKRFYPHDGKFGSFTANLERLFAQNGFDSLVFHRPQGTLRIVPSALTGYRIYATARKAEAAGELFDYAVGQLRPNDD